MKKIFLSLLSLTFSLLSGAQTIRPVMPVPSADQQRWQTINYAPFEAKVLRLDADKLASGERMKSGDSEMKIQNCSIRRASTADSGQGFVNKRE